MSDKDCQAKKASYKSIWLMHNILSLYESDEFTSIYVIIQKKSHFKKKNSNVKFNKRYERECIL